MTGALLPPPPSRLAHGALRAGLSVTSTQGRVAGTPLVTLHWLSGAHQRDEARTHCVVIQTARHVVHAVGQTRADRRDCLTTLETRRASLRQAQRVVEGDNPVHLDSHTRQTKRLEDLRTVQGTITGPQSSLVVSSSIAAAPEVKYVSADIFRHRYSPVSTTEKPSASLTANSTQVKMQRGATTVCHPAMTGGQVVMMKPEAVTETFSPIVDSLPLPTHTTKSSSLSRDISPSRITAQVVSAMSESSQPLLLSALTGKMPAPVMMGSVPRPDPAPDGKSKKVEVTVRGSSPHYHTPPERRPSPLHADGGVLPEGKGVKGHHSATSTLPFENLMRAAALAQAQELHGRSSPVRFSVQQQQASMLSEGRTRTPSPKSAFLARSPQRHGGDQGLRRSPVSTGSGLSPTPSPVQGGVSVLSSAATLSGGVIIPLHGMGLVQKHLMAATLASSSTTTTSNVTAITTSINSHPRSGSSAPSLHAVPHSRPGPAPQTRSVLHSRVSAVPSHSHPSMQLAAVPVDMTTVASQHKVRSVKNSHVISVGTGTDLKQYTSHGAQTKLKVEEMVKLKMEKTASSQGHKKEDISKLVDGTGPFAVLSSVTSIGAGSRLIDSGNQGGGVLYSGSRGQTSDTVTLTEGRVSGKSGIAAAASSFIPLSSAATLHLGGGGLKQAGKDLYKWHLPVPTAAHANKPISVPSSHIHAHAHVHPPPSLPRPIAVPSLSRPSVPVTCASPMTSTVNAVSSTPLTQPTPSLSRAPITTTRVQPVSLSVGAAVLDATASRAHLAAVGVSSGQTVSSAHYQPHHHHYQQHSPPAQTITSQTSKPGPVVKDFIPVVGPPEPPPYRQPPLPSHINPFTFPTSGIKVHDVLDGGPAYSLIKQDSDVKAVKTESSSTGLPLSLPTQQQQQPMLGSSHKSVSDVSRFHKVSDFSRSERQEMPRLTPEGCLAIKSEVMAGAEETLNHADARAGDAKEQLVNPFNQRVQNINNFPSMATAYRSAYRSQSVAMQRAKAGIITGSAKTLDLLRQNLQKSINKELDQIVHRYVERFFKPAAENIRQNIGADSVSEEYMNTVCRQMLEEAKRMYSAEARRSITPITDFPDNVSESGSLNGRRVSPTPLSKRLKASDSDSEKGSDGGITKKVPRRKGRPPLNSSGRSTPLKPIMKLDCIREGPKWDPERIKPDTLFVMGARANKALGLGNTRGRLYIRHPDVFKYSGDQEDKVWLHDQKLLPATGGKAYLLIVEDIVNLSKSDEYKDSPTLMMHECRGFEVPEFMRIKIREAMRAMRADSLKRSRSRSPLGERPEPPKSLPFASFSDTASNNDVDSIGNKNSLQPSPADTEEMEVLSGMDNDDTQPSDISSFKMSGGFDDTSSHSPYPAESLEDEPAATVTPSS
ncbi:hypothetical protein ACOMHN_013357 [Nucella lapillus]